MNVHDEMSDTEVLRAASESLSGLPVASPPDVEAVMARGRADRSAVTRVGAHGSTAPVRGSKTGVSRWIE